MFQKLQLSKPLTVVKQLMLGIIAATIVYASMCRLPELLAGQDNIRGEFVWALIVWAIYGSIMFIHTFFMPNLTDPSIADRFKAFSLAWAAYPIWFGIVATNFFFGEKDL